MRRPVSSRPGQKGGLLPRRLALYTVCHFLVDWACILLVTGPLRQAVATHQSWLWLILTYNACAFAMQFPLGVLADRLGRGWRVAALGAALTAVGWLCHPVPLLACVVAGTGNALFHLGGGREVLLLSGAKAGPAGVFVSSGAVGVWLGVFCARTGRSGAVLPLILLVLACAALERLGRRPPEGTRTWAPLSLTGPALAGAGLLTLTIVLRSWAGTQMAFPWKTGWLGLALVLCVAAGKALGGLLGDRLGWGKTGPVTLLAAAVCFLPSFRLTGAGLAAAVLFNTSMAITLAALARQAGPDRCGAAFGLTTFALFAGLVPDLLSWPDWGAGPVGLCVVSLVSAALLAAGLRLTGRRRP